MRIALASIAAFSLFAATLAISPDLTLRDALRKPDPAEAPVARERRTPPKEARAATRKLTAALRTLNDVSGDDTLGHRHVPWRDRRDVLDVEVAPQDWRIIDSMRHWIRRTLGADGDLELASPVILDWLHRHEAALVEAEEAIAATNWLPWSAADRKPGWSSLNEMRGITGVHALACRDAGDQIGAERALLACWRIERWRKDWPNGRIVALIRQVRPADAEGWTQRLDRLRPREQLIRQDEAGLPEVAEAMDLYGDGIELPGWIPEDGAVLVRYGLSWRTRRDLAASTREVKRVRERLTELGPCGDPTSVSPRRWSPWGDGASLRVLRDEEISIAITRRVLARAAGIDEPARPDVLCASPPLPEHRGDDGRLTIEWAGEPPEDPTIYSLTAFTFAAPENAAAPVP